MMEKIFNYLRGVFNMVAEVDRLRLDVKTLQANDRKHEDDIRSVVVRLQSMADKLDYKEQVQAAETPALKAELEAILLRFERRLPPNNAN